MDTEPKKYIDEHKIKGHDVLIFRDGEDEFLKLLYDCGGRVSMIVWYEYCRINEQRMGMGGYSDTDNDGFMWAETQLFMNVPKNSPPEKVRAYIAQIRRRYPEIMLYPEFYI